MGFARLRILVRNGVMSTASIPPSDALSELVPAEGLPPRLTLLLVASAPDALPALAATLALDSATEVSLTTTVGGAAGLAALRTTAFDAVLIEHAPPALDALLEQARVELDSATRLALYHEIELMLLAAVGVIPVSHGVSHRLVSPRVQGYVLAAMGIAQTHRLSLSPE